MSHVLIKGNHNMPVTMEMQRDGRLMVWKFHHPWTVAEVSAHYDQVKALMDNSPCLIHSLVDLRDMKTIPSGALGLRKTSTWDHPRSGYTVFLGGSAFAQSMINTLFRVVRFERIKFFLTEQDALTYVDSLIKEDIAHAR